MSDPTDPHFRPPQPSVWEKSSRGKRTLFVAGSAVIVLVLIVAVGIYIAIEGNGAAYP